MPKPAKISKDMILKCVYDMALNGEEISVRAIASKLGCSIQPIFYNFATMDLLRSEVDKMIGDAFANYVSEHTKQGKYPTYKLIGMAYISFAMDYPEFFKRLFMQKGGTNILNADSKTQVETINLLTSVFGCDKQTAMRLQTEMWVFVHGFASMIATEYIEWDEESVSEMLTDVFEGLKSRLNLKISN